MSAPAKETAPPAVTEKWAYAGVRLAPNNTEKLLDFWISDQGLGGEMLWSGRRMNSPKYIIGGVYQVRIIRDNGSVSWQGTPRYTGDLATEERKLEWAAQDARSRLKQQWLADMRNASRVDALDQALEPLKLLMASRHTYIERESLMITVMRRLMGTG